MSNKNKKRLGILLLIFGFILSGISFAYWTQAVINPAEQTVEGIILIGTGKSATTTVALSKVLDGDEVLVPTGKVSLSDVPSGKTAVDEIKFTVSVVWTSDETNVAAGTPGTLDLVLTNKSIGGSSDSTVNGHAVVAFTGSNLAIVADGDVVEVEVTVTLNEPVDKTNYDAIANKDIELLFTATVTTN